MITLQNISLFDSFKVVNPELDIFLKNQCNDEIYNYGQLIEYVIANKIENKEVLYEIKRAIDLVDELNEKGISVPIFNAYEQCGEVVYRLERFDSLISATELPLLQISSRPNQIYNIIAPHNIDELKYLMSHVDEEGNMLLMNGKRVRPIVINRIISMVQFYQEHIVRLIRENPHFSLRNNYLFYKDYAEKQVLVWKNDAYCESIIRYLFEHGNNFVFGTLLDNQKRAILEDMKAVLEKIKEDRDCVVNPYYFYDDLPIYNPIALKRSISEQLVDNVTQYVTRDEMINDIVKTRVLNRFIVKG